MTPTEIAKELRASVVACSNLMEQHIYSRIAALAERIERDAQSAPAQQAEQVFVDANGEMREMYERIEPPSPMRNCACCGGTAELWKYRANPDSLAYIPGCSKLEAFGYDQRHECPMYELSHLERSTKREAVRDWNSFNDEIEAARRAVDHSKGPDWWMNRDGMCISAAEKNTPDPDNPDNHDADEFNFPLYAAPQPAEPAELLKDLRVMRDEWNAQRVKWTGIQSSRDPHAIELSELIAKHEGVKL